MCLVLLFAKPQVIVRSNSSVTDLEYDRVSTEVVRYRLMFVWVQTEFLQLLVRQKARWVKSMGNESLWISCISLYYYSNLSPPSLALTTPRCSAHVHVHLRHPYYYQLKPVCWPASPDHIAGSGLKLIEVFWSQPLPKCRFSVGLYAQARLTYCHQELSF